MGKAWSWASFGAITSAVSSSLVPFRERLAIHKFGHGEWSCGVFCVRGHLYRLVDDAAAGRRAACWP